jgi:hypothetical protein
MPKTTPWRYSAVLNGLAVLGSLAALITGIVLRSHYEPIKHACSSGLGTLGQAFAATAQQQCSRDSDLAGVGLALIGVGICCLGLALLNLREAATLRRGMQPVPKPSPSPPKTARPLSGPTTKLGASRTDSATTTRRKPPP